MKHLDVLRKAGLVLTREEGRQRINALNAIPIRRIYERWVSKYSDYWATNLLGLKESLEIFSTQPCPTNLMQGITSAMNSKDTIRTVLQMSEMMTLSVTQDLHNNAMIRTVEGGPHALWLMGHLALVESLMPSVLGVGSEPKLMHWMPLFGRGSSVLDDASAYPSFDEVLAAYKENRSANMTHFESLTEDDLAKPCKNPPPGLEQLFTTWSNAYLFLGIHTLSHRGQLADARRLAGLQGAFG